MERLMKRAVVFGLVLISVLGLPGCAKGDKATKNTLYIEKNGKVTGAIVERWDKDIYKEKELEEQINDEIESYNDLNKDASIKLKKFEIADKEAKVNLSYDSLDTYSDFNNVVAFNGTVKEAQEAGYEFTDELLSTGKKPAITIKEIDGSEEYGVVILSERQRVETGFEILYASSNVKVSKGSKTAVIEDKDSNNAYLVYKK